VRVDLMIEGQEGVTWHDWLSLARAAENGGFGALFRSDHYLSLSHAGTRGSMDAWATLAALATVTSTLRLGTNVSPALFRHPSQLARLAATVDQVSGGRVEVGMGAGWYEDEHVSFGFDFPDAPRRFDVLEEQLEIITRLWTDRDPVDFTGMHYTLVGAVSLPRPVQSPRPPVILGGLAGERAARLAARWADEYNLFGVAPEEVAPKRAALNLACEAHGRDPDTLLISMIVPVFVGEDGGSGAVARYLAGEGNTSDPSGYLEEIASRALIGSPDQIVERMAEYARVGIGRIRLQHLLHRDVDAVHLMGEHIVPAAAAL
jgi:F420-dependent oxidoreductase-like protein